MDSLFDMFLNEFLAEFLCILYALAIHISLWKLIYYKSVTFMFLFQTITILCFRKLDVIERQTRNKRRRGSGSASSDSDGGGRKRSRSSSASRHEINEFNCSQSIFRHRYHKSLVISFIYFLFYFVRDVIYFALKHLLVRQESEAR